MTRARAALAVAVVIGPAAGCTAPPPPPLEVVVNVRSDPGKPLGQAQMQYGGQTIATTDATGAAKLTLHGSEGEQFDVMVACPAGFQSPAAPVTIVLRRLSEPGKIPQYDVRCPPTTRAAVVAVRADRGAGLPILYLGREIGRTDANGAATVLLHVRPQEAFDLMLATTAPPPDGKDAKDSHNDQLRPQNPVATFTVKDQDDVFVFEPRFTIEAKKPVWHAPPPKGPVRIH